MSGNICSSHESPLIFDTMISDKVSYIALDGSDFEPSVDAPLWDNGEIGTHLKTVIVVVMDANILAKSNCIPCTIQIHA